MSDCIPQKLLLRILHWTPVKTLLRWRCVCKSWKQLIDSPDFIADHLAVHTQKSRLIVPHTLSHGVLEHGVDATTVNLDPIGVQSDNNRVPTFICASLHGVICLVHEGNFLLWNPSIRRSIRICSPTNHKPHVLDALRYSFWIDPCTSAFKIVIIHLRLYDIFLYTSGKDAWTYISLDCRDFVDLDEWEYWGLFNGDSMMEGANSIMIDGVTHWIAAVDKDRQYHAIVFFDFGQEKFGTIELPELPPKPVSQLVCGKFVCKWDGLLSFVQWDEEANICDFWVMQNGGSWSKISSFSLTDDIVHVYHVWPDWGMALAATSEGVVLYDPKSGCISLYFAFRDYPCLLPAVEFVESLVFPYRKCVASV